MTCIFGGLAPQSAGKGEELSDFDSMMVLKVPSTCAHGHHIGVIREGALQKSTLTQSQGTLPAWGTILWPKRGLIWDAMHSNQ